MPELFRFFGFTFFFYSREHEPIHVHAEGKDGYVVLDYDEKICSFVIREKYNVKNSDLRKIQEVVEENKDIIINRWKDYFNRL